jgi:hypothetical protein
MKNKDKMSKLLHEFIAKGIEIIEELKNDTNDEGATEVLDMSQEGIDQRRKNKLNKESK